MSMSDCINSDTGLQGVMKLQGDGHGNLRVTKELQKSYKSGQETERTQG